MKKNILGAVGFILIVTTVLQGSTPFLYLLDWSNGEMVGRNLWTVFCLVGGVLMIKSSMKKVD